MKKLFLLVACIVVLSITSVTLATQEVLPLPEEIQHLLKKEGKLFDMVHDYTYFPTSTVRVYWNTNDGNAYALWMSVNETEDDNIEFLAADSTTVLSVKWTAPDGVREWYNFPLETTLRVLQEKYFEELDEKSAPDNSREKLEFEYVPPGIIS